MKKSLLLSLCLAGILGVSTVANAEDVWVYSSSNNNYYVDTNYVGGKKTADIYAVVKEVRPGNMPFGVERYSFGYDEGNWYYSVFNGASYNKGKVSDSEKVSKIFQVVKQQLNLKY